MHKILSALIVLSGLLFSQDSVANKSEALCAALDRPNIDCACVAERMDMFESAASSEKAKSLLNQAYLNALGRDNKLSEAIKAYNSDPMAMISAEAKFDQVGGRPENVGDFEAGCVIPDAAKPVFPSFPITTPAGQYVETRVKSVGEAYRGNSQCLVARMKTYLSDEELEAYMLSFSYYEGDHTNDDAASRATKMGISKTQFNRLEKSARKKLKNNQEKDESYCSAMTYANKITPSQNQNAKEQQAKYRQESADAGASSTVIAGDDLTRARQIMQTDCTKNGGSDAYCQCVITDFETKVVEKSPRPAVTLAWTLMRAGSNIPNETFIQLNLNTSRDDQQAAGLLFTQTLDVGDNCVESVASTAALKGSPRERMIEICMAENGNRPICECTTDKMREKISADDFELVVDLREADYQGADDPLAVVAADRGLTAEEAQRALETNQSLVMGMMSMDLMSCMGGMPDFSQMPGMPKMPGQ